MDKFLICDGFLICTRVGNLPQRNAVFSSMQAQSNDNVICAKMAQTTHEWCATGARLVRDWCATEKKRHDITMVTRVTQTHSAQTLLILGKVMRIVRAGHKRGQCVHPLIGGGAKLLLKLSIKPALRLELVGRD